jgi:hypothetical protein
MNPWKSRSQPTRTATTTPSQNPFIAFLLRSERSHPLEAPFTNKCFDRASRSPPVAFPPFLGVRVMRDREQMGDVGGNIFPKGELGGEASRGWSLATFIWRKGVDNRMKRHGHVARIAVAALVVSTVLSLSLWTPASAQIVPPNRNAVNFSAAFFSGSPVWQLGFSYGLTQSLDFTAFWAYQSISGSTGNLVDGGVRYHFLLPTPGADLFVGAGLANISGTTSGFGSQSSTGLSLSAGGSLRLAPTLTGYAGVGIFAFSGSSNSIVDAGVQLALAPKLSGQIGLVDYAGSTAGYVGLTLTFPGIY